MACTTLGRFRSMTKHLAFLALATAALTACDQNRSLTSPTASLQAARDADVTRDLAGPGAVYTLTNQAASNAVAVFTRGADGRLTWSGSVATGGTGSGGALPISLTVRGNVLYVLNAGGSGNISGFTVGTSGDLTPIAGATLPLSGSTVGPAEVQFSPDGSRLLVTEKNTNLLDVYAVDANGAASGPTTTASAGGTPFGFAFGLHNDLFVSEAAGSASSYVLDASGTPALVSGAVATHQGAPCWAVVTADGRFGFTGNGAGSVSAFAIAPDGAISLVDATGGTALIGAGINDIALSHNSRYLYVLQTGGAQAIHAFRVQADGHLTPLGPIVGLPNGTRGLAAF